LNVGGGSNQTNVLNTFDIFDVSTRSFIKSGTMKTKRTFHTATLIPPTGKVLVCGGVDSNKQVLASCERFQP
jgi:hypothetical protein